MLSALEWENTDHPEHARPAIRDRFKDVYGHSVALSQHIQSGNESTLVSDSIEGLRKSLGALTHALATRHKEPPKD